MLNPNFRDILQIFCDEDVEFLLVGAYALAAHGYPRATGDIDLWVNPTGANAERVIKGLTIFGAPLTEIKSSDFASPGIVFQIGIAPSRIDILTQLSGLSDFNKAWESRIVVDIEEMHIPVLNRELLKQNKRSTGRPKDLADLAWLESDDQ